MVRVVPLSGFGNQTDTTRTVTKRTPGKDLAKRVYIKAIKLAGPRLALANSKLSLFLLFGAFYG